LSLRIPLAGAIATLVGSFVLIDAGNADFRVFDPVGLNVAMFMMLVGLTGSATTYWDWVLQCRLPTRSSLDAGALYASLVGSGALLDFLIILLSFFVAAGAVEDPPRVAGGFFLVATVGTFLSWTRHTPWRMSRLAKAGMWIGTFGLAGMLAFSGLHMAGEITEIL